MGNPHILAIPYPLQGHVIPLMELSQRLVKHGFKVTFVNTESNHKRVMNALTEIDTVRDQIHLVSLPEGLCSPEERNDLRKLSETMIQVMPGELEKLIREINESDEDCITCVIADVPMGWALEVADKMGIQRAAFWPASASLLALNFSMQKLIDDGTVDNDGIPIKNQMIQLSPTMPSMKQETLVWACIGDEATQKVIFKLMLENNKSVNLAEWLICNSTYELEPGAFTFVPKLLPIGPLLASNRLGSSFGNFWPEDSTCLKWLDQQPPNSVIYVAFGSFTVFDQYQFQELALGLELSNRPFLWVVRPDTTDGTNKTYPTGFQERIATRGQMVGWAPQQKVLAHPSVACFLSHCGWNSTMEGVSNGVPFLCWPHFADQFLNETYICDVWKVGLGFNRNDGGIITRHEIKNKIEQVLGNENLNAMALNLKEMAMNSVKEGSFSNKNFKNFVTWLKA